MHTTHQPFSIRPSLLAICTLVQLALAALLAAGPARAQNYPAKPVTIIVPFAPGGGTDIGARLVAQKLTLKWGQPVVVDNRGGAGGVVGADAVAKARPDGYTLLVGNVGTQSINPSLYKKLPYDPDKAFAPVSLIAELPFFALARPTLAANNIRELITLAKANPGKISFASSGNGGSPHLSGEILQAVAGVQLVHVPYKGGGPAMNDLMAGHVDLLFASVLESVGHVRSGKLKTLGVSSATRSAAAPDIPTIAESGLKDFDSGSWLGLFAPAGTPVDIINKIALDVKAVLDDEATRQLLVQQGATPHSSTPAQLAALTEADRKRYAKIILEKNLSLE